MKPVSPNRLLLSQRRRFRDATAAMSTSGASTVRLFGFLFGGILLANLVLMASATLRSDAAQPADMEREPAGGSSTRAMRGADGRAAAETDTQELRAPAPAFVQIDRACAEYAREKLMVGMTSYYLQRRIRPGAGPEDVADTSSLTTLLAGPGDPAATLSSSACSG